VFLGYDIGAAKLAAQQAANDHQRQLLDGVGRVHLEATASGSFKTSLEDEDTIHRRRMTSISKLREQAATLWQHYVVFQRKKHHNLLSKNYKMMLTNG
jgi:hypothetical protein